ncbi:MAG: Do family serine endopeptidase [Tunicatimonas sp.]
MKNIIPPFIAALFASLVTLAAYHFLLRDPQTIQVEPATQTAFATYLNDDRPATSSAAVAFDFTTAAAKVTPAVVHITSTQGVVAQNDTSEGEEDPRMQQIPEAFRDLFGDMFRGMPQQQGPRSGSGSGVIISSDGYIVTNNHVVADADELTVVLTDNRSYLAKVIGADPTTDVALIKIDEKDLPALTLANSDNVKVGEWVMAAGNPLMGLNSTVTAGIVSATGRNIDILRRQDQYAIESFIQTDAAVNPGNSGGALTNVDGDLIGINTAIMSPTGSYAGYSFAVPSNIVKKVVDDLKEYGKVQRALIGVQIVDVNAATAKEFDLNLSRGVYVQGVMDGGAGAEAGLKEGDVIVQVDEKRTNKSAELQSYIGRKRPGDQVDVIVVRDGNEKTFTLKLKGMEGSEMVTSRERSSELESLGAQFKELNKEELSELDLESGVQVVRTYPGKLRQQGVRPGFVITRVANKTIKSMDDLTEVVKKESGGVLIEGVYPDQPEETQFYGIGL